MTTTDRIQKEIAEMTEALEHTDNEGYAAYLRRHIESAEAQLAAPTVGYRKFRVAEMAFRNAFRKVMAQRGEVDGHDLSRCIEVYIDSDDLETGLSKSRVNWAAIGSTSPADAVRFADALALAARLAERFPYNGDLVSYGE